MGLKLLNLQGWIGLVSTAALAVLLGLQVGKTHFYEVKFLHEQSAHRQTIINYQQAAEKARAADAANKARAEAEQKAVIERTKADYEERIAHARADAQRLREQLSHPHPGSSGEPGVPSAPGAGPGTPSAPEDHGLSIDERLIATEQAIQLDALIDYVEGVLKVDLSGPKQTAPGRS